MEKKKREREKKVVVGVEQFFVGIKPELDRRICPRAIVVVGKRSREKINKLLRLISRRVFPNTSGCFIKHPVQSKEERECVVPTPSAGRFRRS